MMKRVFVPALSLALLQAMGMPTAMADADWDRFAASRYVYCDAVILGAFWGESVDDAKVTIGRKLGWGNGRIVASNLNTARRQGQRCEFQDTHFVYEDALALAQLWEVSVEDAKVALAEKVSTGYTELANEVVGQAHEAQHGGQDDLATTEDLNRFENSEYEYCDAVMLGAYWDEMVYDAKIRIGRKLGWGDANIVRSDLVAARNRGERCAFDDTGFSYDDANALAQLWGVSTDDAKVALAEKVSMGWRTLAFEVVNEAYLAQ